MERWMSRLSSNNNERSTIIIVAVRLMPIEDFVAFSKIK
jgi:hypothetical protein